MSYVHLYKVTRLDLNSEPFCKNDVVIIVIVRSMRMSQTYDIRFVLVPLKSHTKNNTSTTKVTVD